MFKDMICTNLYIGICGPQQTNQPSKYCYCEIGPTVHFAHLFLWSLLLAHPLIHSANIYDLLCARPCSSWTSFIFSGYFLFKACLKPGSSSDSFSSDFSPNKSLLSLVIIAFLVHLILIKWLWLISLSVFMSYFSNWTCHEGKDCTFDVFGSCT